MIMVTCWERCESRGSRTVLREADGEVPLVYSPTYQMIEKLLEQIEQLKQIIVKQGGTIEQQNIIMIKQNEKIEELEKRLNKNSSNSSKPPSTDSFKKKSHKNNSREKTDKTTGGQIGHKGRTLIASEKPEVIIDLTIESCEACNQDLGIVK